MMFDENKTSNKEPESAIRSHKLWLRDPGIRKLNLGICFMFSSAASVGYTGGLINGLLTLPYFAKFMSGVSPQILGLLVAAGAIGGLVSFVPGSYIADILGRKMCVAIGSTIVVISAIIQAVIPNKWAFLSTRVVAGFGSGLAATAAPLLVTEIAHPHMRQSATALYNCTWYLGAILSAVVVLFTLNLPNSWSWRLPCLLQLTCPSIQLFGLFLIPESPRWLIATNKRGEALVILTKYHANGELTDRIVQHEFEQMCRMIPLEKEGGRKGWCTFFSSKGYFHILSICVLIGFMEEWAGNGIISYFLAPILASIGMEKAIDQASVNLGIQVWNLIISGIGALASERYGRRLLWLGSTILMIVFLAIITITTGLYQEKHISSAGIAVVPFLFLFFAAYDLGYTPLMIAYPAEILPFELRAKGVAITFVSDAVAAFSNQYVNPVGFYQLHWRYYCVFFGCLFLFLVSIYFLFPETKGRSLEEVSEIFHPERKRKRTGQNNTANTTSD